MSGLMRAAVWHGPNDLRVEQRPIPEATPGSVVVRVRACTICGSDLRILRDGNPRIVEPRVLGHEVAGDVVAVGAGAKRFQVGDRVAVGADVPCGQCVHCLGGRANCCDVNLAIGYQFDGGFAEYLRLEPLVVEQGPVLILDRSVDYAAAALAEPLACCLNGYERALLRPGATVAIFGAGPIGLMLAMLGPTLGASRVLMVEPLAARRESAAQLSAVDVAIDPTAVDPVDAVMQHTGGTGADVIFTACAEVATHGQAIAMVAKRGVVNLFGGLPSTAPPVQLLSNHLHYREAYVTGSHGATPEHHAQALALIESRAVDVTPLISASYGIADIGRAFEHAGRRDSLKVVVRADEQGAT